jgi:hypothetical protein
MGRAATILLVILAAALGVLAGRLAPLGLRIIAGGAPVAAPPEAPGSPPPAPPPPPPPAPIPVPSVAALGDGRVIYADGAGRLFVLGGRPLAIEGAFALRADRGRFLTDPARRAASGFYLDDLAAEGAAALERARAAFDREAGSLAVDTGASERAEASARAVIEAGDASFLLARLGAERYPVRRAAALALGRAGFVAAAPVLAEVAAEEAGTPAADRVRALLAHLAGRPIPDRASFDAWWSALAPADRSARR